MPWGAAAKSARREPTAADVGDSRMRKIPKEIFEKIQAVDNETSTLSGMPQGLSQRVLDRFEYCRDLPDGTPEWFVVQQVELIKRPGQTLGLYIREGDGLERNDGVFISRIAEGSEVEKYDILKVNDEILSVNSVDVSQMPIDEVVVIMSIPRRLVLKTKFRKHPLRTGEPSSGRGVQSGSSGTLKPVVILKKNPSDESKESSVDEGEVECQTAQTSLGAKMRSSDERSRLLDSHQQSPYRGPTPHVSRSLSHQQGVSVPTLRGFQPQQLPQRPMGSVPQSQSYQAWDSSAATSELHYQQQLASLLSARDMITSAISEQPRPSGGLSMSQGNLGRLSRLPSTDFHRNYARYLPRVLDSQGRLIQQEFNSNGVEPSMAESYGPPPTGSNFALPPRLPQRAESLKMEEYSRPGPVVEGFYQNQYATPQQQLSSRTPPESHRLSDGAIYSGVLDRLRFQPRVARLMLDDLSSDSDGSGGRLPGGPKSVLRQPGMPEPVGLPPPDSYGAYGGLKSNSLPRRRVGRVKWRNDVVGGSRQGLADTSQTSDSDGAASAPELPFSPTPNAFLRDRFRPHSIRTVDDIFTSAEYRAWNVAPEPSVSHESARQRLMAQQQRLTTDCGSRTYANVAPMRTRLHNSTEMLYGGSRPYSDFQQQSALRSRTKSRSSSLPPRGVLESAFSRAPREDFDYPPYGRYAVAPPMPSAVGATELSYAGRPPPPVPLKPPHLMAPSSQPAQQQQSVATPVTPANVVGLAGLLVIHILEGRTLKIPDKMIDSTDELYCVIEVDGEHRARTSVSTLEANFAWNEAFEVDVIAARTADFYVYSWHPQFRHKLCHRGSLQLLEVFVESTTDRRFALSLEPRGTLLVAVSFMDMSRTFQRVASLRRAAYFATDLNALVDRENTGLEVPVVLRRLIEEIERRGVDTIGLYQLCGCADKKLEVKNRLEKEPMLADISPDSVPDVNVLTGTIKDFLRELPEPIFPTCIYQMLFDAWTVCVPNDKEGNVRLMLGVVDCLPRLSKCTLMVLMDHLKCVSSQSDRNGLDDQRLSNMFGPLIFCTARTKPEEISPKPKSLDPLDPQTAAEMLKFLLQLWPTRTSSSESSGSENSTINLTNNGTTSLVDLWLQENRLRESNC